MSNLDLWVSVERTDPAFTKEFTRGGGFKGTATNATYLAKKATERFGPMGIGWGVEVLDEQYVEGAPYVADGAVIARETIHKVRARLWYVLDGKRGEVQQFGQTVFLGRNKNGFVTDEEHAKKSLTDAMSKCLSLLGFSADIHMGRYDDNKYVAELRREFAESGQQQQHKWTTDQAAQFDLWISDTIERVRAAASAEAVREVWKHATSTIAQGGPPADVLKAAHSAIKAVVLDRGEQLSRVPA